MRQSAVIFLANSQRLCTTGDKTIKRQMNSDLKVTQASLVTVDLRSFVYK